jgi:hypothetical protein
MAGFFTSISSAISGGDTKLVGQIEDFAAGYLGQGEVARNLALRREEQALLAAILAEELYRSYCTVDLKRPSNPRAVEHLEGVRKAREIPLQVTGPTLDRLESALRALAVDLVKLAREKGKFETKFASADGLSESQVQPLLNAHANDLRAAKRQSA